MLKKADILRRTPSYAIFIRWRFHRFPHNVRRHCIAHHSFYCYSLYMISNLVLLKEGSDVIQSEEFEEFYDILDDVESDLRKLKTKKTGIEGGLEVSLFLL